MLILYYNSFFGAEPAPVDCGRDVTVTADRRRLRDADIVVFHLPGARFIGDAPRKYPGQTWVAWSMESTVHTPWMDQPELMRHFDLTMTFSRKSDVWVGYVPPRRAWEAALARPLPQRPQQTPLVMFQSASIDHSGRNAFCAELMRQLPFDSYGRMLNNRRLEIPDRGFETKREVIGGYKFALGAENTFEADYVTEKFFDPLLAGAVPVYRGAPNVADYAPGEHCFIDANAFKSPAELADYLRYLDADDAAYGAYLAWRQRPLRDSFVRLLQDQETEALCRLADLVARRPRPSGGGKLLPFGLKSYARTKVARLGQSAKATLSVTKRRADALWTT